MVQSLTLTLKETVFSKKNTLTISPEYFEYQNISLSKFEIDEIRYGVKAITGSMFRIGRIYCIDVKSLSGNIMKIRLKSLYGIRKKRLNEKFTSILDALWENFMQDLVEHFINLFRSKVDFYLVGISFTQEGILPDKKSQVIPWNDLGTKNYSRYCAIFSKGNPNNYKAF